MVLDYLEAKHFNKQFPKQLIGDLILIMKLTCEGYLVKTNFIISSPIKHFY